MRSNLIAVISMCHVAPLISLPLTHAMLVIRYQVIVYMNVTRLLSRAPFIIPSPFFSCFNRRLGKCRLKECFVEISIVSINWIIYSGRSIIINVYSWSDIKLWWGIIRTCDNPSETGNQKRWCKKSIFLRNQHFIYITSPFVVKHKHIIPWYGIYLWYKWEGLWTCRLCYFVVTWFCYIIKHWMIMFKSNGKIIK